MSLFIYHERQTTQSALCGVHCLNSLLQRPAFTEFDLAKIAKELDDKEREVMASEGDTKEYLKFLTEESSNVGDDGNFSLQVLEAALHKRNLECLPLTSTNYYTVVCNLSIEKAFICNRGSHWFSIRKVLDGEWFNFNSLLDAPQHFTESYLASFLDDLFDKKDVCIYAVRGNLPSISPENKTAAASGRWLPAVGVNREDFDIKIAIEASKAAIDAAESKPAKGVTFEEEEISYPKLPDFKNEKISYPKVDQVTEEPLAFKSKARAAPPIPTINTKDLPIPDHIRLISEYFERCLFTMEKMDQRLTAVENTFARIQAHQR